MDRRTLIKSAGAAAMLIAAARPGDGAAADSKPEVSLDRSLEPYLGRYNLPALAAAVVKAGEIVAAGAVGTRRAGTTIPVTLDDPFHIGSNAKPMTSTLAAMLVDGGKLGWESTLADIFPELTGTMAADAKGSASTMLQPKADFAMVPATNIGGAKADEALRALTVELHRQLGAAR